MAIGSPTTEEGALHEADAELATRASQGDMRAFRRIYERFAPVVSRRLRRVLWIQSDVEDVLQMTFIEVHRSLARFQVDRSLAAWIHGIAFRVVGTHLRTQRRRAWLSTAALVDTEKLVNNLFVTPDDDAATREVLADATRGIGELSDKKRIALLLHELEGLSMAEIGEMLSETPQTINARVQSARDEVRLSIERAQTRRQKSAQRREVP